MLNRLPVSRFRSADWVVIAANLVPVYGVWFLGWSAVDVFIVYALETLIAGVVTVLKLGVLTIHRRTDTWHNGEATAQVSGWFFILFFVLHFGLFAAVQTSIFSQSARIAPAGSGVLHFFFNWYSYIHGDTAYMLAGFLISYLSRQFIPFIVTGEYRTISMTRVMFQPYGRIVIQQFTVIIGSMFLGFGLGKVFILIFALAKIAFEVFFNLEDKIDRVMEEVERKEAEKKNPPKSV